MLNRNYKQPDWQYLFICACGMTSGLAGWDAGYLIALATAALLFYMSFLDRGYLMDFQVQVRMTYLIILLSAYPEPMNWLYWVPTAGTWIYVLFDYCLLARLLSLAPYYSTSPFSASLIRDTLLKRPVKDILNPA